MILENTTQDRIQLRLRILSGLNRLGSFPLLLRWCLRRPLLLDFALYLLRSLSSIIAILSVAITSALSFTFCPFVQHARKLDILKILPLFLPGLRKLDAELRCMYSGFVRCLELRILLMMRRLSSDSPICSVSMFHLNFGRYFIVHTSSLHRDPFLPPIGCAFSISATERATRLSLNSTHPSV